MSLNISLIQLNFFLLTLVDNLETHIKNENFKDSLRKILRCVCVYVDIYICTCVWKFV